MTRTKRRDVAALTFAATCGFLAGMAVMAVLTLAFGAEPYLPSAIAGGRTGKPARETPIADARPAAYDTTQTRAVVPDATLADGPERPSDPPDLDDAVEDLRRRKLEVPLATIDRANLRSSFAEARGGARLHEAMDLLAPRHTPVRGGGGRHHRPAVQQQGRAASPSTSSIRRRPTPITTRISNATPPGSSKARRWRAAR